MKCKFNWFDFFYECLWSKKFLIIIMDIFPDLVINIVEEILIFSSFVCLREVFIDG